MSDNNSNTTENHNPNIICNNEMCTNCIAKKHYYFLQQKGFQNNFQNNLYNRQFYQNFNESSNYNLNDQLVYIKNSIDRLGYEIEKLKTLQQIERNDNYITNQYIDKSISEFNKIKNNIQEINDNNTCTNNTFRTFDKRINDAFKKINKLNNDFDKLNNKKSFKHKDKDNDGENEDQSFGKIIKISSPSQNLQLLPFLNLFGGMDKKEEPKNELLDSEDEYDNLINVYEVDSSNEEDNDIIEFDEEIKSIDNLIEIGLKFKKDKIVKKDKIEKTEKMEKMENPKKILEDLSNEVIKKVFSINTRINNIDLKPFGKIKITKIGGEEFSSESELDETETKDDNNDNNDNKDNDDNDNKKINKYFKFNNKKYALNIEKIINLIEPLQKLKNVIGMNKVKEQILDMILYYIQGFESETSDMLHTSIEGPPGVGKTKLGRILAHIYSALGVIPSKRFKRVRRTDLIGKYVGHTAHKTQEVIDEAEGGVLFIDEAYSLGDSEGKDTFSKECIDTINQNLTEKKKNLIVIIAGYSNQLEHTFFALNEGLRRRFPFRFQIDGYDEKEMTDIFYTKIQKLNWKLDKKLDRVFLEDFFKKNKDKLKNYGGDIETLVMNCKMSHAHRVIGKTYKYKKIINIDDLKMAYKKYIDNNKKNENSDHLNLMYI
jgi:hypothetical protein